MVFSEPCVAITTANQLLREPEEAERITRAIAHCLAEQMIDLARRQRRTDECLTFRFLVSLDA